MLIKKIFLSNIRNLKSQEIELGFNTIFLSGKNGQGKTSLLEAIFILSHLRSFRSSSLTDIINTKEKSAYVGAIMQSNLGEFKLEVAIQGKKRELLINSKKVSTVEIFCGQLKTVLFTPEDLEIIKGAPQVRRQFLDRVLAMLDPKVINLLSEYSKRLKFRNALLRNNDISGAELLVPKLSELNNLIVNMRIDLVNKLKTRTSEIYSRISGQEEEGFELIYQSSFIDEHTKCPYKINEIEALFKEEKKKEEVLGRTTIGCHRDELKIDFINKGSRMLSRLTSSQGQTRTKVLSIKLASAEIIHQNTGEWPIFLLDDVEAELDKERTANLRTEILNYKGQVFLTGTELVINDFNTLNTKEIRVHDGVLLDK